MDTKRLLIRIGTIVMATVLAIGLVAPVFAGGAETAELKGTVEKVIYKDQLPQMALDHGILKVLKVDGVKLLVTDSTEIGGMPKLGTEVEARGEVHAIGAETIKVMYEAEPEVRVDGKAVTVEGAIDKIVYRDRLPTMLTEHGITKLILVDGVHIFLTEETMTDGMLKVGTEIRVEGCLLALLAEKIDVQQ
jgi:hypothetical protein